MDLSPDRFLASTINIPSVEKPQLMRIKPGKPDESYLLRKLHGTPDIEGDRMPLYGEPLPDEQIRTIASFIESLPPDLPPPSPAPGVTVYPFPGWKVINLPTARSLQKNTWLFFIGHRFNPQVDSGYESFYGLDGSATILLGLGYAFTDRWMVGLGRTNASDVVELESRYVFTHQQTDGMPVATSLVATVDWRTEDLGPGSRLDAERFSPALQFAVTRQFGDGLFSLTGVPGVLLNPGVEDADDDVWITLGVGLRLRASERLALLAEWVPVIGDFTRSRVFGNEIRFESWGSGLEIVTAGHVFQLLLSNAPGLATEQYLRGGDLDVREMDIRLGFNIFRTLAF